MVIQGQQKAAVKNIVLTIAVNLILAVLLAYKYSGAGMAVNVCLVNIFIAFLNARSANKKLNLIAG